MTLDDSLVHAAFTTGNGFTRSVSPTATLRIAVRTPDGTQYFLRPEQGDADDWRASDLENSQGGFRFDEPISKECGLGLEALTG